MTEPNTSTNTGKPPGRPHASFGRLLLIAVTLLVVGIGGASWWTFGDGEKWWGNVWLPAKVEFRGKVTLDGQPLRGGQLMTWPDQRGVRQSVGFIGDDGEFTLRTDIDGDFIEQAFVGRHRISVLQFAPQVGATAPKLTSPVKYSSPDSSGLAITVDRDPAKNNALLELTSDAAKDNNQPSKTE